jgi:hypothetical protein
MTAKTPTAKQAPQSTRYQAPTNEWSQAPCLMTSLPPAPAMMTLVVGRHPVGLNARTVGVRARARIGAMPQAGLPAARAEAQAVQVGQVGQVGQVVAGHSVTTGVPLVQVPAEASGETTGGVIAGRIVVGIVVLVAGRNVKASGVARC